MSTPKPRTYGARPGNDDQLVPVRHIANLAIGMRQMKHSLRLARLGDFLQISSQRVTLLGHEELREVMPRHLLHRASDHLSSMRVDRQQIAAQIMRAHHAQRTFDELPVPRLALAQRSLRCALRRNVDARRDDERHLSLRIGQRRSRPCDAPQLPSRFSHWFSNVAGKCPERSRSNVSIASGMSCRGISLSQA